MSERVTMPALGESVTEGTVTRWLKSVGDSVQVDEPLLEVSTDKVDTEIPSPVAGTLEEILVQEDETVPVGADLAVIGDGSGGSGSGSTPEPAEAEAPAPEAPSTEAPVTEETSEPERAAQEEAPEPEPTRQEHTPSTGEGSGDGAVSGGQTVTMPALGESVTEGTVTRWLKAEGDDVAVDEPLLEVSTDKVDTEIPSPFAGKLTKILVGEDETVLVGADLAIIGGSSSGGASGGGDQSEPGHDQPAQAAQPEPEPEPQQAPAQAQAQVQVQQATESAQSAQTAPHDEASPQAPATGGGEGDGELDASSYVTPLVRKLAADHGVDLGSLTGTGVGGRIRKQDVLDAAKAAQAAKAQPEPERAAAPAAPAPASSGGAALPVAPSVSPKRGTVEKMSRMRKVIASRMVESLQVSAQLTTVVEVDVTRLARLRAQHKEAFKAREGVSLSFLPFFALAAVEALKAFPVVNAQIEGDTVVYHGQENLGVAVDTQRGLMVPVIRDAGDLNVAGLARKIADLAERTRTGKIGPDELGGGTFTLTNTGSRGALFDTPIINQPQVAILGTGAVVKRPMVVEDGDGGETIAIRSMCFLALSYDHRLVDGADAARFLVAMKERLEEGNFEL